jgi:hypothetical protein
MHRRRALTGIVALTAWMTLSGEAADRQWKRGPEGDLLMHTNGEDPGSGETGELLVKQLRNALPDSGARVGQEPTALRLASVMAAPHPGLAVIAYDIALEMYRGAAPFQAIGPIELRVLVENYKYQVLCRTDFERNRAYMVTEALMKDPLLLKLMVPDRPATANRDSIPTHPGALAFLKVDALDKQ